jgi:hypothetical protein
MSWYNTNTRIGAQYQCASLMGTQHPAVLGDHPVVSAQSQLSTCGDATRMPVHKGVHTPTPQVTWGGFGGQSI